MRVGPDLPPDFVVKTLPFQKHKHATERLGPDHRVGSVAKAWPFDPRPRLKRTTALLPDDAVRTRIARRCAHPIARAPGG